MGAASLCTRVKNSDIDNYKKLTRVMQYIRDTSKFTIMIEPSNNNPKWWVDSLYPSTQKSHTEIL